MSEFTSSQEVTARRVLDELQRAHEQCHRTPCPMHLLEVGDILEVVDVALVQDRRCCDLHGRTCEPPSELCCVSCTEVQHPGHDDGSVCAAPDVWRRYGPVPR